MVDLVIQAFKILMFEFTSSKLSEKMHESIRYRWLFDDKEKRCCIVSHLIMMM
jgi:hypothetical protein